MEIEFTFRQEESGIFGLLPRPIARIVLINKYRVIPHLFYVDSGADITLIPKSLGELLGFRLRSPKEIKGLKGIGESEVPVVIRKVRMQMGDRCFMARLAWCLVEEAPPLLGRLDIFPHFDVLFSKSKYTRFTD